MQSFQSGVDRRDAHVYSVAGVAHHRLTHDLGRINQAVLVSGESGAGKVNHCIISVSVIFSPMARIL